jgi:hypothetical protein
MKKIHILLIVLFGVFLMPTSTLHVVTIQEKKLAKEMSSRNERLLQQRILIQKAKAQRFAMENVGNHV